MQPEEDDAEEPYDDEYDDEDEYYIEAPSRIQAMRKNNDINLGQRLKSTVYNKNSKLPLFSTYTQKSGTQSQQIAVNEQHPKVLKQSYNIVQKQNSRIHKDIIPSHRTNEKDQIANNLLVPNGFQGTINVEKKYFTKSLPTQKLNGDNMFVQKKELTDQIGTESIDEKAMNSTRHRTPDSYVTVTKSVTGTMDNSRGITKNSKNFQSTFYTKSSTCGYFTFSCNIVYGENGRSKICRPKTPTKENC